MHSEHAVEYLRRNKIAVRANELNAHDRRFDPADHKEEQSVYDVHDAQPFVIYGRHPFVNLVGQRAR